MSDASPRSSVDDSDVALRDALRSGALDRVRALVERGVDLANFRDEHGYDALQTAAFGRGTTRDADLGAIIRLLAERGVPLDGRSAYGESALSVFSRECRFDAIRALLDAGAPESLLEWTPLCREVALGTANDVRLRLAEHSDELEAKD